MNEYCCANIASLSICNIELPWSYVFVTLLLYPRVVALGGLIGLSNCYCSKGISPNSGWKDGWLSQYLLKCLKTG